MHLLDTNTLSYMLRGEGGVGVRMLALKRDQVAVPAVVVYELRYGLARLDAKRPSARALMQKAEALLAVLRTVAFDEACATAAASLRADLERVGTPLGPIDTLIASTALATRSVLVTRNTPQPIVERINREVIAIVNSPELKARLAADGAEAAAPNTPAQFQALIVNEAGRWGGIIQRLGLNRKAEAS